MRIRSIFILGSAILTASTLLAQSSPAQPSPAQPPATTWELPQHLTVKDSGPRTYRFTVDYNMANNKGEIIQRQRLIGDYTRGLANGEVSWKDVSQAQADGLTTPFAAAQKRDFMEGFKYRDDLASTMNSDFFKGFPPTAVFERNLVWDTGMMEYFGQGFFDHLSLNVPFHSGSEAAIKMPGVGSFQNRDIVLEWVGRSRRNGQDCALIQYQAFMNPLDIANGGMTMKARSDYWGEIWVSLATKQIEYGTIYENVTGELKLPGQDTPQNVSVFRAGAFEPVNVK
ncbi:MAG: hypothetical protein M3O31_09505 [Acidobacteriota bacterium]|nr:hypothetical protein [Acidobacteriota bacterium]